MSYRCAATLLTACIVCAAQQSAFDIARSLQDQGRYAEAETYYRRALKSDPQSVPALTNLGVVLARQGKYIDAIAAYRSALALDPSGAAPKVNLAIAYFQIGDCKSATEWLESTLETHPEDRRSLQLLGVCQLELGRFHEAAQSFERLMPSEDPSILLGAATAYVKVGRTEEGHRILDKLVREHGDSPGVEVAIGMADFGSGEYGAASEAFRAALDKDPENADARFYLGAVLFKQRDFDSAIREWRQAVQQKPGYFPPVFALGAMFAERRQYQEAKPLLRKALELRPDHPGVYLELGKIAVHEQQYETALRYLREAARLDPQSKPTSFLLATTLQRLGREKEAQSEFARSRTLYREDASDVVESALQDSQAAASAHKD
jgi:tetratricopeptide (TPR) repeat protein